MNRKQFLMLVFALLVLGGVGIAMFWQEISAYRATGAKIGGKLLPEIKVADVAQIELRDADSQATLVRKEKHWVVQERNGYPADFKAISDLIIKLIDLKVVQSEAIGESLYPRVELVEPGKGEAAGTLVVLKDASGKALASVILGRTVLKKDPGNPLPSAQDGVPAGRYVRVLNGVDRIAVVADPLTAVQAEPGRWLDKTFFKVDRVKTLTVTADSGSWKITRDEEWGQWKLAGAGTLEPGAAVTAVNALGQLEPKDVAAEDKPEAAGKPTVVTAETFDNLMYTLNIAKRKTGDDYLVNISVAGEPPRARTPEQGEKADEKERRDKEFAETRQRLEARLAREKAQAAWTYIVDAKSLAPLLKSREEMTATRAPESAAQR